MVTLMIMGFENSAATYREMTMAQAYHLASNGNFYKAPAVCVNCGVAKSDECEHKWEYYYPNGRRCAKCGAINV